MTGKRKEAAALLGEVAELCAPAVLASSLGPESMVLLDIIAQAQLPIGVFTLDTGRLHQETYDLLQHARQRYPAQIVVYAPSAQDVEAYVSAHGPNGFYDGVELRRPAAAPARWSH